VSRKFTLVCLPIVPQGEIGPFLPPLDQLAGIVFGAVIDDQNLEISMRLGGRAFQGAVEGVGTIEGRDENSKTICTTVDKGLPSGSIRVHLVN
jgi:hypothetical protein